MRNIDIGLEEVVQRGRIVSYPTVNLGPYPLWQNPGSGKLKNWLGKILDVCVGKYLRKLKNNKWMKNREEKQKQLIDYLMLHPDQLPLVKTIIDFVFTDRRFSEERVFYGGSTEIREWERIEAPQREREIKNLAEMLNCHDKIGKILAMVFLSLPELFLENSRSHPQKTLDNYYQRIEKGDYAFFKGLLKSMS